MLQWQEKVRVAEERAAAAEKQITRLQADAKRHEEELAIAKRELEQLPVVTAATAADTVSSLFA